MDQLEQRKKELEQEFKRKWDVLVSLEHCKESAQQQFEEKKKQIDEAVDR